MSSIYTENQYTKLLKNLLPSGPIWPREEGTDLHQFLDGHAVELQRIDEQIQTLIVESYPETATELIGEWETDVGLPDACFDIPSSLDARRNQVLARLTLRGGASKEFFIKAAGSLRIAG